MLEFFPIKLKKINKFVLNTYHCNEIGCQMNVVFEKTDMYTINKQTLEKI